MMEGESKMLKRNLLHIFILCLVMGSMAAIPKTAGAEKLANYTAGELKALIDSGTPIFLLNPLSEIEFNEGHIPDSVNIPAEEILTTQKLPKNKNMHIITYCKGPK